MGKWQLSMVGVTFLSLNLCLGAKAQFSFYIALVDGVFLLNSSRLLRRHVKVIPWLSNRGAVVLSMFVQGCLSSTGSHRRPARGSVMWCHMSPLSLRYFT